MIIIKDAYIRQHILMFSIKMVALAVNIFKYHHQSISRGRHQRKHKAFGHFIEKNIHVHRHRNLTRNLSQISIETGKHLSSSPVQSSPVQSSPVQSSPVQSSPVQSSPVQSSPVQSSPVQSSPVQSSPVQCSAVQCSAVQCSAVQCSYFT